MTASPLYARLSQELGLKPKAPSPNLAGAEMCSQPLLRLDHGAALLDYVNSRLSEHSDCASSSSSSSSNQATASQAGAVPLLCTVPRAAAPLLKAVSVPVQLMSVGGQWQRAANGTEITLKFLYSKKSLAIEARPVGGDRKSRMDVTWADLSAMRLLLTAEDLAVLELDIGQPPTFKHELPPQARRHTLWSTCDDFTAGVMTATRTLRLVCEAGMLDGPMESLLSCDERLAELTASGGLPTAAGPLPADAANSPLATAEGIPIAEAAALPRTPVSRSASSSALPAAAAQAAAPLKAPPQQQPQQAMAPKPCLQRLPSLPSLTQQDSRQSTSSLQALPALDRPAPAAGAAPTPPAPVYEPLPTLPSMGSSTLADHLLPVLPQLPRQQQPVQAATAPQVHALGLQEQTHLLSQRGSQMLQAAEAALQSLASIGSTPFMAAAQPQQVYTQLPHPAVAAVSPQQQYVALPRVPITPFAQQSFQQLPALPEVGDWVPELDMGMEAGMGVFFTPGAHHAAAEHFGAPLLPSDQLNNAVGCCSSTQAGTTPEGPTDSSNSCSDMGRSFLDDEAAFDQLFPSIAHDGDDFAGSDFCMDGPLLGESSSMFNNTQLEQQQEPTSRRQLQSKLSVRNGNISKKQLRRHGHLPVSV
eukprot:jgi/Astpho2/5999/fgenesh1_pg.00084_%23_17_t